MQFKLNQIFISPIIFLAMQNLITKPIYFFKFFFCNIQKVSTAKCNYPFQQILVHTNKLEPISNMNPIPTYRVINLKGIPIQGAHHKIDPSILNKIYQKMLYVQEMDTMLLKAKGQGLISFYMTSFGQNACTIACAAALQDQDLIFPQYRQQGVFIWRGFTIEQIINQCMGNGKDAAKGRQMPVHYGSAKLNIVTISSPLTTQVPQASGAGYGFRTSNQDKISVTYFGQGAASEGDFHTALNFAATLKCQTLFLCRNNHYAISTHYKQQFITDGIVDRAVGYGIASLKVDGNDALAVFNAVKFAREWIIKHKQPFFIEFMTYRMGDHSTSDHSGLYREQAQKSSWRQNNDPIKRLANYLKSQNIKQKTDEEDVQYRSKVNKEIIQTLKICGKNKLPKVSDLFSDVYSELTVNLKQQREQLEQHIRRNPDKYELNKFES